MMKRSRVINVSFGVALPCDATREQVLEWIVMSLGGGGCDADNPLLDHDIDAIDEPVLTDTKKHLREHVEVTKIEGGSIYTRTTKRLQDAPSDMPSASEQCSALLMDHYNSTVAR